MKANHTHTFLISYIAFILITAVALAFVEPKMNFGNAIWYCFSVITTTGLGDVCVITVLGKILSIILGVCSLFALVILTALVVNYYREKMNIRSNKSVMLFLVRVSTGT